MIFLLQRKLHNLIASTMFYTGTIMHGLKKDYIFGLHTKKKNKPNPVLGVQYWMDRFTKSGAYITHNSTVNE